MILDGTQVLFQHAVNNRAALARFLESSANMAEGDVLWGTLEDGPDHPMAIMAHPPALSSDLSFNNWVRAAVAHDRAIKVDLKTPKVIDVVIQTLHKYKADNNRLIINADVIQGPAGDTPDLNTEHLLRFRHEFPRAILSPSATTGVGGGKYSSAHIQALVKATEVLAPPTTLPLRAEFVLADPSILQELKQKGVHVTIWSTCKSFVPKPGDFEYFRQRCPSAFIDLVEAPRAPQTNAETRK